MTRYRTIPGVVLTSICGEYVLVAAKALRGKLPYLSQLNESSAFLWRLLEKGADVSGMEQVVLQEYEVEDPAAARAAIQSFVEQMSQAGYLLQEGEEHE